MSSAEEQLGKRDEITDMVADLPLSIAGVLGFGAIFIGLISEAYIVWVDKS